MFVTRFSPQGRRPLHLAADYSETEGEMGSKSSEQMSPFVFLCRDVAMPDLPQIPFGLFLPQQSARRESVVVFFLSFSVIFN
jgi:hypothetical protein